MSRLALSMIVRDGARDLRACLESVVGVVDEMIIADTGSRDETPEIARSLGAQVISVPWTQDFSAARNAALRFVKSDWVLVLDADEELDPSARDLLRPSLGKVAVAGYRVLIRHYVSDMNLRGWDQKPRRNESSVTRAQPYPGYVEKATVRLFRRAPNIYFEGRIHEMVDRSILCAGGRLSDAGFCIHHYGHVADHTNPEKDELYRSLLRLKVQDMPDDALAHIELGVQEMDRCGNPAEALHCFDRAMELEPQNATAWLLGGIAAARLGLLQECLQRLANVPRDGSGALLLAETEGEAYFQLGQFDAAAEAYGRALASAPEDAILASKLGLCELRAGQVDSGLARMARSVRRDPCRPELHDRLISAYVWLDRLPEAARAAENKLVNVEPTAEAYLRAASIYAQMQRFARVRALLREGLQKFPDAECLLRAIAEVCS